MRLSIASVLLVGSLICAACERPADESPSKFQRQANIQKYAPRAKKSAELQEERLQPLAVEAPLDISKVSNQMPVLDLAFLQQTFTRTQQAVQARLQETYAADTQAYLDKQLAKHQEQLHQVLQNEQPSVKQTTDQVEQALEQYYQEAKRFVAEQKNQARFKPNSAQMERISQRLDRRSEDFLNRIALYYGDTAALKSRPILEQAVKKYKEELVNAPTEELLTEKINTIIQQAREKLDAAIAETGDPLGHASEETIAALRSDMISSQQEVENRVERLYGKEAVLQTRKPFNQLLEEVTNTLREDMRLSQKKNLLARFNHHYQENILALQQQWNASLEQGKPIAAITEP